MHERSWLSPTECSGKSLAYTRIEFFNPSGDLVAYGRMSILILSTGN
jgi:hypothetical protein